MKNLFKNLFKKKKALAPKTLALPDLEFDEKTQSLHQKTKTGFNTTKWRNLEQEIEKNLEEHFEDIEDE